MHSHGSVLYKHTDSSVRHRGECCMATVIHPHVTLCQAVCTKYSPGWKERKFKYFITGYYTCFAVRNVWL